MLKGKKIILGVTASIAAYKSVLLCRSLVKAGAEVKVVMTPAARDFVGELTFSTLSTNEVHVDVSNGHSWNNHVELGLWADAFVVAPATANTLSKMANGLCDNILMAAYLSAKCPVFFAPAMDLDMWKHPSTIANVERLKSYGNHLIPVGTGELASGLSGAGRMAEPEEIMNYLQGFFGANKDLLGKKIMITAGPTHEAIDPVRFIGNRSSGKMGIALAQEVVARGGKVVLILGPTHLSVDNEDIEVVRVQSALDMHQEAVTRFPDMDVAIMAAAVADYRPVTIATEKIKKKGDNLQIDLVKNPDIAKDLGEMKKAHQITVGFALETNEEEFHAKGKLERKNFDFIVLNSLRDKGAGFNFDTNKITIIQKNNKLTKFELKSKAETAIDIIDQLSEII